MDWKEAVHQWLEKNDRSQAWLARRLGITPEHFNRCLRGFYTPGKDLLARIQEEVGVKEEADATGSDS
jgi:ribosome-binding protein aMBF1 (putative translation factor)